MKSISTHGGRLALVYGEAGIGKSTLIESFIDQLPSEHTRVVSFCDAFETPRALAPVRDIARYFLGPESGEHNEDRYFDMLIHHLLGLGQPVVLVIEDLHWADQRTLDWLQFIGRRLAQVPVLLIATYRDDELDVSHPLYSVIGIIQQQRIDRLNLKPLSLNTIEKMCCDLSMDANTLFETTSGNPFFVTEMLNTEEVEGLVPNSVSDVINARLNRLPVGARTLLEYAACFPREVPLKLLEKMKLSDIEDAFNLVFSRKFLVPTPNGARFQHELVRVATYGRMTPHQKQHAHTVLLREILLQGANTKSIDMIVHHADGAQDAETVLEYAPRAATLAAQFGAHKEAADHLRRALRYCESASIEDAAVINETWAYEAGIALTIDDAVIAARHRAIELWQSIGNIEKVGENLSWLSRLHWYRGEAENAQRYVLDAMKNLEESSTKASPARARALALRAQYEMLQDKMEPAIHWARQALDQAVLTNEHEMQAHSLNTLGSALLFRDKPEGETYLRESLHLALKHGFHEQAARVYTNLSECLIEIGALSRAAQLIDEGIAFDSEHDLDAWTYYLVGRKAQLRFEQGNYDEAILIADSVLSRDNQTLLMKIPAMIVRARSKLRRGDKDWKPAMSSACSAAERIGEPQYSVVLDIAKIEAEVLHSHKQETNAAIENICSLSKDQLSPRKAGEFLFWVRQSNIELDDWQPEALPDAFHCYLEGNLKEASNLFLRDGMVYFAAWSLNSIKSPEASESAIALFTNIGANAALIACGGHIAIKRKGPYKVASAHPYKLTQQEQKILKMIVEGLSNLAISEDLCRSRRTVENHVSSILSKLNCKSRLDVALRTQSEPWILP
jgi:DNA-binding CsgD family transcriptional regulator/tetratricopeptide (TPR) repeat protein